MQTRETPIRPKSQDSAAPSHWKEVDRPALPTLLAETLSAAGAPDRGDAAELLLRNAVAARATDIHIDPGPAGHRLLFRIDGAMQQIVGLSRDEGQRLINQLKTRAALDPITPTTPVEARRPLQVHEKMLDLRLTAAQCVSGEKLTIRLLDRERLARPLSELGLSADMRERIEGWLGDLTGMFLVTGPMGSGKTTTLYALLDQLRVLQRSIVTLEDPVEYAVDGASQIQVNEDVGLDFATGIKAMLRMDADLLLIGEIRDPESARAATDAAASGRVLLSTMHSNDATGAISSLRNWGLQNHEICASVAVIVAQRLVRTLCPTCRRQDEPTSAERRWLHAHGAPAPERSWHAAGCGECDGLGYRGRTGVFEVWRIEEDDIGRIITGVEEHALRDHLGRKGHASLLVDALAKAREGVTSIEELRCSGGFGRIYGHVLSEAERR